MSCDNVVYLSVVVILVVCIIVSLLELHKIYLKKQVRENFYEYTEGDACEVVRELHKMCDVKSTRPTTRPAQEPENIQVPPENIQVPGEVPVTGETSQIPVSGEDSLEEQEELSLEEQEELFTNYEVSSENFINYLNSYN